LAYQQGDDFIAGSLFWVSRTGDRINEAGLSGLSPSISPDGRWVATARTNSRGENEVWVADLTRGVSSRLTQTAGVVRGAVWSPDSRRLAYLRTGSRKIYVRNADGSGDEDLLADNAGVPTSWSPDGKYLVHSTPEGKMFLMALDGKSSPIAVGSRSGSSRD